MQITHAIMDNMKRLFWLLLLVSCQTALIPVEPTPIPTPTLTPFPTATPLPEPNSAAGFRYFLQEVENALLIDRPALANRYWSQVDAPIMDGETVIWFYRGAGTQVELVGDTTGWETPIALTRISGTEFYYLEQTVAADARIDYQLIVDGTARLDPSNPQRMMSGFGLRSVLTMPAYRQPPVLVEQFDYANGTLHEHALESAILGQTRTFFVYQPAGQLIGAQYPSLYVHDGSEALTLIDMPDVLDRLIGRREIPPLVAVFIPPITRQVEYNGNDSYMEFVAREIVPFVQENYAVDRSADQTGVWGASLGGLLAIELGGTYGDVFGRIFAQSPAISMSEKSIAQLVGDFSADQKLYLNVGIYETAVLPEQPQGDFLAASREMHDLLSETDIPFSYNEWSQGHSWGLWQDALPAGLQYLFRE